MGDQTILGKHAALVDEMGTALGVDLEEEVLRGTLDPDILVDAVLSCTNCTNPGACENWLAAREGVAAHPPDYCRNGEMFERLQDKAHQR